MAQAASEAADTRATESAARESRMERMTRRLVVVGYVTMAVAILTLAAAIVTLIVKA